jgi:hypothetical protein
MLMVQAYEAADRNDYTAASAKLDEADHLQGPLGTRIADVRHRSPTLPPRNSPDDTRFSF